MHGGAPHLHQHATVGLGVVRSAHLGVGGWVGGPRSFSNARIAARGQALVFEQVGPTARTYPHDTSGCDSRQAWAAASATTEDSSRQAPDSGEVALRHSVGPGSPIPAAPAAAHLEHLALHVEELAGKGEGGTPLTRPRLSGQLLHPLLLVVPGLRVLRQGGAALTRSR